MKNILHVTNIYFTLPYFIGDQFIYFNNKGNNLHVICSPSILLSDYADKMKFNYSEVNILRAIRPIKDLIAIFKICRYIKVSKIDIVVGHTPKGGLLAMLSAYLLRVPKRIYFRHGLVYETSTGFKRKLLVTLDRITAFCATDIVCVSPSVYKRSLVDKLNRADKQLILGKGTCTGIDIIKVFNPFQINLQKSQELRTKLELGKDSIVIGYCGRLVCDKGIVQLIQAFDLVKESNPGNDFRLLLVGMFEQRDSLPIDIVNQIQKDKDIIITGFINENIEYYYALMNVYVLPSFREGFPTSVLEASSMQIPILTTRVTGCIDSIIEDVTGIFVENSSISIANGIEYYLNHPSIANEHGRNGRDFVTKYFDQEIIWSEIEKLYEK
ncbi:glycosyltransferase family 4 protein [Williamwhitmania taraxaci]|uniref:Glycosyltransferase involved in cell wall bisynthesis n=1 Tax=Williamwhitmania taraxaci TaxID=1640674 RepID=A0A1G6GLJ6_9BACT|nr:glycosyltransferase family 4 protein [Williamwhitmania taraxaci]SDB82847.1 Glycosyltransferase involved in cell wall bisynthesis [Williamwhitmania taraxaci]